MKVGRGKLSILKMILRVLQIHETPPPSLEKNRPNGVHGEIRRCPARASVQRGEGRKSGGKRGGVRNRFVKGGEFSSSTLCLMVSNTAAVFAHIHISSVSVGQWCLTHGSSAAILSETW